MNIIGKKWWYFVLSGLIIVPGLISLLLFGLKLGIDYTGGTLLELKFHDTSKLPQSNTELAQVLTQDGVQVASISNSGPDTYLFRLKAIDNVKNEQIKSDLSQKFGNVEELQYDTVGPTISGTLSWKTFLYPILYPLKVFGIFIPDDNITLAFSAVFWASLGILAYIAWSFRKMPKPASSWRFGVAAIAALLHDVLVVIGIFSILGKVFNVEIDALFITALLTVMGFSVHDTIVVFDRIRENLYKYSSQSFATVVNTSMIQTLGRSLTTSLTVIFVLLALLLFGGTSIRWFIVALLVGIISGTYSSIFNASPILVVWQDYLQNKRK